MNPTPLSKDTCCNARRRAQQKCSHAGVPKKHCGLSTTARECDVTMNHVLSWFRYEDISGSATSVNELSSAVLMFFQWLYWTNFQNHQCDYQQHGEDNKEVLLGEEQRASRILLYARYRRLHPPTLFVLGRTMRNFFWLAAAWVDPGRNALQSAEQRC